VTDEAVLPYVRERLPAFTPVGEPIRLPEGNLNVVWRLPGTEGSLIIKYAPPYIAAEPDVPLDPFRLTIEARCLRALGPEGRLSEVGSEGAVHTPRLVDFDEEVHVLLMKDLGDVLTLDRWLRTAGRDQLGSRAPGVGWRLGSFLGHLHRTTFGDATYRRTFENRPMQETRHAVQYQRVSEMLERGGVDDAEQLAVRARALGEVLLEPGRCLTMGDLWPPSVLVSDEGISLIDWELAHYGRPLQDVAHALAHFWMQVHRAPSPAVVAAVEQVRTEFLQGYRRALGETKSQLWTDEERHRAAVHIGAEILVRAVGPFQAGYVYEGLAPNHPVVQEAVTTAARHLRDPASVPVLGATEEELP